MIISVYGTGSRCQANILVGVQVVQLYKVSKVMQSYIS